LADLVLEIDRLTVTVGDKAILKDCSLRVHAGEVCAIMGPNGSGKSTLSKVIAGHPAYQVTSGSVRVLGKDLGPLAPEERARLGVFIGFQYPVEVPGVNNAEFLRLALNAQRTARGEAALDAAAFAPRLRKAMETVGLDEDLIARQLNSGFSGGQKKRNEILQMLVLEPRLALLDETDSGLDIDAMRVVAKAINGYRAADRAIVLVTHYQRLLALVVPDSVHVFAGGRIVQSGGKELALELEAKGYDAFDGR
jgi:Fe-S cluster assembly ATP-binding protein